MTRPEKIHKLAHAIHDYRGLKNLETKKWLRPPNPAALVRVKNWLTRLNLDVPTCLKQVEAFKLTTECDVWLRGLDTPKKCHNCGNLCRPDDAKCDECGVDLNNTH
jgi:hypothetical protein